MVDRWEWVRRRSQRECVRLLCDPLQLFEHFLALEHRRFEWLEPMSQ